MCKNHTNSKYTVVLLFMHGNISIDADTKTNEVNISITTNRKDANDADKKLENHSKANFRICIICKTNTHVAVKTSINNCNFAIT